jgi:hypothetical protein
MLLAILPNWNSLDSVRQAHSDLELAGLVFFALLVVAEALAHNSKQEKRKHLFDSIGIWFFAIAILCEIAGYWYGQRNDALSEQKIRSLDALAEDADTTAKRAKTTAGWAATKADAAKESAGRAQQKVREVDKRADELSGDLQSAKTKLDAVDAKRAELDRSLRNMAICTAPRVIPHWQSGWTTFFDPLKQFAGRNALIEVVPNDAETLRAASNLYDALKSAGWQVTSKPAGGIFDGVEVRAFEFPSADRKHITPEMADIEGHSRDVAGSVVAFLHSYNWEAKIGWPSPGDRDQNPIPPNGIRIRVGLYPPVTYVAPPAMKRWAEATAEAEEQRKQNIKKREDEYLSKATPEQKAVHEAWQEREKQLEKVVLEPFSNPCQPLEPLTPPFP